MIETRNNKAPNRNGFQCQMTRKSRTQLKTLWGMEVQQTMSYAKLDVVGHALPQDGTHSSSFSEFLSINILQIFYCCRTKRISCFTILHIGYVSYSIIFPRLVIIFPLDYEDIVNIGIDWQGVWRGRQALVPEGGSKINVIAGTQYKALTESCWIWLSDNDRASRKLVVLEMETRLSGIED